MSRLRTAFTLVEFIVVILIIFVFFGTFGGFPFQAMFHLLVGWAHFLSRNIGQLTLSTSGLLTFVVLSIAIVVCIVWVRRGLFATTKLRLRSAVAITLCIIALFTAGIGATGVAHQIGWLIRSPEPLLSRSSVAYNRMMYANKQKSVGIGFHYRYQDRSKVVDRPFDEMTLRSDDGTLLHGWQTQALPYIEQQALYESIDLSKPWNSEANAKPLSTVVPEYIRQGGATQDPPETNGSYALSHLAMNALLFGDEPVGRFRDISDGLSNTFLFGSARGQFLPWGHPQNWRSSKYRPNEDDLGYGSNYIGGCHMGMADGAVIFITDSIDRDLWNALFTPSGGEDMEDLNY